MASAPAAPAPAAAAPAAMPSTDEAWKVAQKIRAAIHKELEHIQKGGPGTNEIARFEKVEKLMENYRLACIETIWPDMRAADKKNAEDVLWQTHTMVTKAYRKVLARLQANEHVVVKRKLEKLYSTYLKTAQYFYRGYLQRVCARYDMKDLKRLAGLANLEEMAVPDKDKVDPAAAQLEDIVKGSCHKTLIYLGDLARYRTLLRTKDRKWEGALAYYFLANDLIPESGYGHHQCGVIYVETEDHLEVVYHLYRSLACALPHPNASTNLDREFRDLLKRKSITTKHALVTWFVKLHAFYSQGKEFNERKELEREVDHRLAAAMKTGTGYGSDTDLLKIVLINITAYVTAQDKIHKNWTDEASRACQFILLLNVRTIQAIAHLLGDEITSIFKRRNAETSADAPGTSSRADTETKFTAAFNRALPLLRIYMAWLCSYSADLVEFRPHLEPQFGKMCTALAHTLTLLFALLGSDQQQLGATASWRFLEDEMTLGIKCLNGPGLHDGCQLSYDPITRRPKPRRDDISGATNTDDDVSFTRALDVLLCALDLSAPESKFPLTNSTTMERGGEVTNFVYLEGGKPAPAPAPAFPTAQQPAPTAVPSVQPRPPNTPVVAPSPCQSNELSEDREFYGPSLRNPTRKTTHHKVQAPPAPLKPVQAAPISEFPIDRQMFNILNDFINPPESTMAAKPATPARPSPLASPYGMDSAAVAKAFGAGDSNSPAPGSAGAKKFPTLPWEYFYVPEPVGPNQRNSDGGMAGGWGSNGSGLPRPTSSGNAPPLARPTHQRYDSLGKTRFVENQAEALQSLNLGPERTSQPPPGFGGRGIWGAEGAESNTAQQNPWAPSANPWQSTYGQNTAATADRVPSSPFSTLNFSANTSSLPQVNSPWGMPATTTAQRFSATQSPASPTQLGGFPRGGGGSIPSPSENRYTSDYATAMATGGVNASQGFAAAASAWSDARQPRNGFGSQLQHQQQSMAAEIWGSVVGQGGDEGGKVVQGMPKR